MAEKSYTVFNAMVDIVASPGKALDEIKQHTSWLWWPLLISIVLACGLFAYFYNWVDFEWLVEETIRQVPAEDRAASADAIRSFMSPKSSMITTLIAVVVMTFLIYLIEAIYFHLVNKVTTGSEIGFGQWFSFAAWTAFVGIFGTLAGFVMIFTAGSNQMSAESLQVLSINNLLLHASPGDPWFRWGSSLTLINIWMLVLMSIGYARWTGAAMVKSAIIACLPWVLIFGIWAATI
ncbi:MAG: YIP1 family protein [Xanthomonadales bacterium]|jgi:hypothetical protein|nr:YIP1 family protein [Xanthomonadales bacterium]